MFRSSAALCIVTFIFLFTSVEAQRLNPSNWNKKIESKDFVEGTYSLPVSSAVKLISFHRDFQKFKLGTNQELYFNVEAPSSAQFLLKVQERKIKDFYMLESQPAKIKKGFNQLGPWKIDDFLKTFNISANNLGVVCQLNEDNNDYVLPVSVLEKSKKSSNDDYVAILRLSKKISGGVSSIYLGEFKGKLPEDKQIQSTKIGRHPGGATIQVQVEADKLKGYSGWVTVHLSLSPVGSRKKIPYTFFFYHS